MLHVYTAMNPQDRGSSPGHDHYVTTEPFTLGRIRRVANDALCRPGTPRAGWYGRKPRKTWWGLQRCDRAIATCPRCLEIAARLAPELARVELPAPTPPPAAPLVAAQPVAPRPGSILARLFEDR